MCDLENLVGLHPSNYSFVSTQHTEKEKEQGTHVGKRIVVLIPPGQAFGGKATVSTFVSEQGAALSPPKFFAV
jgi:hypothetical protein